MTCYLHQSCMQATWGRWHAASAKLKPIRRTMPIKMQKRRAKAQKDAKKESKGLPLPQARLPVGGPQRSPRCAGPPLSHPRHQAKPCMYSACRRADSRRSIAFWASRMHAGLSRLMPLLDVSRAAQKCKVDVAGCCGRRHASAL